MRLRDLAFPILIIVAFIAFATLVHRGIFFPKADAYSVDILTAIAIIFSVIVAYIGYTFARGRDSKTLTENKRDEFIRTESLAHMRMLIEHNDIELQTVVMILNIVDPYESETLPRRYWELHKEFDQYLDFLEGISIQYNHGDVFEESVEGLWAYYSTRLVQVDTLDHASNTIKQEQIEQCMKNIYEGSIPDRIENAWQKALKGCGYEKVADPITNDDTDPLRKPIWCYIKSEPYSFTPLIKMICELSRREVKSVNEEHNSQRKRLLGWIEFGARFIVWASVLGFAVLTVLGVLPILPEPTSIGLLILLYIFIVAALVQWTFDVKRLFPPKRK